MVCRQPVAVPDGWVFEPLLEDRFVIACAPGHALSGMGRHRQSMLRSSQRRASIRVAWAPRPLRFVQQSVGPAPGVRSNDRLVPASEIRPDDAHQQHPLHR